MNPQTNQNRQNRRRLSGDSSYSDAITEATLAVKVVNTIADAIDAVYRSRLPARPSNTPLRWFGADVTVFQRGDRLLPDEDLEVSEVIESAFEDEGITVQTGAPVTALTQTDDGIHVDAGGGDASSVTVSDVALDAG